MIQRIIPSIEIPQIDRSLCWFNPGCAMNRFRPELSERMLALLRTWFGPVRLHTVCCHHDPGLPPGSIIINNCAGCDRRFRSDYEGIQTISIWEVLDALEGLPLPSFQGLTVSVHDSCSFRQKPQVHTAVRSLLSKMGIKVVESPFSGTNSICCGDNFYGRLPNAQVIELQQRRADQMPCDNVVVYCIGCVRAMAQGGKRPRYLPDLIFGRDTPPMAESLDDYHLALEHYICLH